MQPDQLIGNDDVSPSMTLAGPVSAWFVTCALRIEPGRPHGLCRRAAPAHLPGPEIVVAMLDGGSRRS